MADKRRETKDDGGTSSKKTAGTKEAEARIKRGIEEARPAEQQGDGDPSPLETNALPTGGSGADPSD